MVLVTKGFVYIPSLSLETGFQDWHSSTQIPNLWEPGCSTEPGALEKITWKQPTGSVTSLCSQSSRSSGPHPWFPLLSCVHKPEIFDLLVESRKASFVYPLTVNICEYMFFCFNNEHMWLVCSLLWQVELSSYLPTLSGYPGMGGFQHCTIFQVKWGRENNQPMSSMFQELSCTSSYLAGLG